MSSIKYDDFYRDKNTINRPGIKINNIPIESGTGFIGDNSIDYKDRLTDLKTYVKCSEEDSCNLDIPNTIKNNFSKIKEYIKYHITYPVNSKNINANGYTNITTDDPENTGSYYFFGDEIIFVNNSLSFITDLLDGNTINQINYNIVDEDRFLKSIKSSGTFVNQLDNDNVFYYTTPIYDTGANRVSKKLSNKVQKNPINYLNTVFHYPIINITSEEDQYNVSINSYRGLAPITIHGRDGIPSGGSIETKIYNVNTEPYSLYIPTSNTVFNNMVEGETYKVDIQNSVIIHYVNNDNNVNFHYYNENNNDNKISEIGNIEILLKYVGNDVTIRENVTNANDITSNKWYKFKIITRNEESLEKLQLFLNYKKNPSKRHVSKHVMKNQIGWSSKSNYHTIGSDFIILAMKKINNETVTISTMKEDTPSPEKIIDPLNPNQLNKYNDNRSIDNSIIPIVDNSSLNDPHNISTIPKSESNFQQRYNKFQGIDSRTTDGQRRSDVKILDDYDTSTVFNDNGTLKEDEKNKIIGCELNSNMNIGCTECKNRTTGSNNNENGLYTIEKPEELMRVYDDGSNVCIRDGQPINNILSEWRSNINIRYPEKDKITYKSGIDGTTVITDIDNTNPIYDLEKMHDYCQSYDPNVVLGDPITGITLTKDECENYNKFCGIRDNDGKPITSISFDPSDNDPSDNDPSDNDPSDNNPNVNIMIHEFPINFSIAYNRIVTWQGGKDANSTSAVACASNPSCISHIVSKGSTSSNITAGNAVQASYSTWDVKPAIITLNPENPIVFDDQNRYIDEISFFDLPITAENREFPTYEGNNKFLQYYLTDTILQEVEFGQHPASAFYLIALTDWSYLHERFLAPGTEGNRAMFRRQRVRVTRENSNAPAALQGDYELYGNTGDQTYESRLAAELPKPPDEDLMYNTIYPRLKFISRRVKQGNVINYYKSAIRTNETLLDKARDDLAKLKTELEGQRAGKNNSSYTGKGFILLNEEIPDAEILVQNREARLVEEKANLANEVNKLKEISEQPFESILLQDASEFPPFGTVKIGKEKIIYRGKDGNRLINIIRGVDIEGYSSKNISSHWYNDNLGYGARVVREPDNISGEFNIFKGIDDNNKNVTLSVDGNMKWVFNLNSGIQTLKLDQSIDAREVDKDDEGLYEWATYAPPKNPGNIANWTNDLSLQVIDEEDNDHIDTQRYNIVRKMWYDNFSSLPLHIKNKVANTDGDERWLKMTQNVISVMKRWRETDLWPSNGSYYLSKIEITDYYLLSSKYESINNKTPILRYGNIISNNNITGYEVGLLHKNEWLRLDQVRDNINTGYWSMNTTSDGLFAKTENEFYKEGIKYPGWKIINDYNINLSDKKFIAKQATTSGDNIYKTIIFDNIDLDINKTYYLSPSKNDLTTNQQILQYNTNRWETKDILDNDMIGDNTDIIGQRYIYERYAYTSYKGKLYKVDPTACGKSDILLCSGNGIVLHGSNLKSTVKGYTENRQQISYRNEMSNEIDDTDKCLCFPGYSGDKCQFFDEDECNGNGIYMQDASDNDYYIDSDFSLNGELNQRKTGTGCLCKPGYSGEKCKFFDGTHCDVKDDGRNYYTNSEIAEINSIWNQGNEINNPPPYYPCITYGGPNNNTDDIYNIYRQNGTAGIKECKPGWTGNKCEYECHNHGRLKVNRDDSGCKDKNESDCNEDDSCQWYINSCIANPCECSGDDILDNNGFKPNDNCKSCTKTELINSGSLENPLKTDKCDNRCLRCINKKDDSPLNCGYKANGAFFCNCKPGWTGEYCNCPCADETCKDVCYGNGQCTNPDPEKEDDGGCKCDEGSGNNLKHFDNESGCSRCDNGWTGQECNIKNKNEWEINNINSDEGNAKKIVDNTCLLCKFGWEGPHCNDYDKYKDSTCVNGFKLMNKKVCNKDENNKPMCNDGWWGENCDQQCPIFDNKICNDEAVCDTESGQCIDPQGEGKCRDNDNNETGNSLANNCATSCQVRTNLQSRIQDNMCDKAKTNWINNQMGGNKKWTQAQGEAAQNCKVPANLQYIIEHNMCDKAKTNWINNQMGGNKKWTQAQGEAAQNCKVPANLQYIITNVIERYNNACLLGGQEVEDLKESDKCGVCIIDNKVDINYYTKTLCEHNGGEWNTTIYGEDINGDCRLYNKFDEDASSNEIIENELNGCNIKYSDLSGNQNLKESIIKYGINCSKCPPDLDDDQYVCSKARNDFNQYIGDYVDFSKKYLCNNQWDGCQNNDTESDCTGTCEWKPTTTQSFNVDSIVSEKDGNTKFYDITITANNTNIEKLKQLILGTSITFEKDADNTFIVIFINHSIFNLTETSIKFRIVSLLDLPRDFDNYKLIEYRISSCISINNSYDNQRNLLVPDIDIIGDETNMPLQSSLIKDNKYCATSPGSVIVDRVGNPGYLDSDNEEDCYNKLVDGGFTYGSYQKSSKRCYLTDRNTCDEEPSSFWKIITTQYAPYEKNIVTVNDIKHYIDDLYDNKISSNDFTNLIIKTAFKNNLNLPIYATKDEIKENINANTKDSILEYVIHPNDNTTIDKLITDLQSNGVDYETANNIKNSTLKVPKSVDKISNLSDISNWQNIYKGNVDHPLKNYGNIDILKKCDDPARMYGSLVPEDWNVGYKCHTMLNQVGGQQTAKDFCRYWCDKDPNCKGASWGGSYSTFHHATYAQCYLHGGDYNSAQATSLSAVAAAAGPPAADYCTPVRDNNYELYIPRRAIDGGATFTIHTDMSSDDSEYGHTGWGGVYKPNGEYLGKPTYTNGNVLIRYATVENNDFIATNILHSDGWSMIALNESGDFFHSRLGIADTRTGSMMPPSYQEWTSRGGKLQNQGTTFIVSCQNRDFLQDLGITWDDYNNYIYNLTTKQNNDDITSKLNEVAVQDYGDSSRENEKELTNVRDSLGHGYGIACADDDRESCQSHYEITSGHGNGLKYLENQGRYLEESDTKHILSNTFPPTRIFGNDVRMPIEDINNIYFDDRENKQQELNTHIQNKDIKNITDYFNSVKDNLCPGASTWADCQNDDHHNAYIARKEQEWYEKNHGEGQICDGSTSYDDCLNGNNYKKIKLDKWYNENKDNGQYCYGYDNWYDCFMSNDDKYVNKMKADFVEDRIDKGVCYTGETYEECLAGDRNLLERKKAYLKNYLGKVDAELTDDDEINNMMSYDRTDEINDKLSTVTRCVPNSTKQLANLTDYPETVSNNYSANRSQLRDYCNQHGTWVDLTNDIRNTYQNQTLNTEISGILSITGNKVNKFNEIDAERDRLSTKDNIDLSHIKRDVEDYVLNGFNNGNIQDWDGKYGNYTETEFIDEVQRIANEKSFADKVLVYSNPAHPLVNNTSIGMWEKSDMLNPEGGYDKLKNYDDYNFRWVYDRYGRIKLLKDTNSLTWLTTRDNFEEHSAQNKQLHVIGWNPILPTKLKGTNPVGDLKFNTHELKYIKDNRQNLTNHSLINDKLNSIKNQLQNIFQQEINKWKTNGTWRSDNIGDQEGVKSLNGIISNERNIEYNNFTDIKYDIDANNVKNLHYYTMKMIENDPLLREFVDPSFLYLLYIKIISEGGDQWTKSQEQLDNYTIGNVTSHFGKGIRSDNKEIGSFLISKQNEDGNGISRKTLTHCARRGVTIEDNYTMSDCANHFFNDNDVTYAIYTESSSCILGDDICYNADGTNWSDSYNYTREGNNNCDDASFIKKVNGSLSYCKQECDKDSNCKYIVYKNGSGKLYNNTCQQQDNPPEYYGQHCGYNKVIIRNQRNNVQLSMAEIKFYYMNNGVKTLIPDSELTIDFDNSTRQSGWLSGGNRNFYKMIRYNTGNGDPEEWSTLENHWGHNFTTAGPRLSMTIGTNNPQISIFIKNKYPISAIYTEAHSCCANRRPTHLDLYTDNVLQETLQISDNNSTTTENPSENIDKVIDKCIDNLLFEKKKTRQYSKS